MKWQPNLSNTEHRTGTGLLLKEAIVRLKSNGSALADSYGVYGYETEKFVLVAKKYIYGSIVSCHEEAVTKARLRNKKLVMFIGDAKAFYEFEPIEILRVGKPNSKGNAKMLNFDIKLGRRFD